MKYNYKIITSKEKNEYPLVQELFKNKICTSWTLEEIKTRWRWPWDESAKKKSFERCKDWLQVNHPELML